MRISTLTLFNTLSTIVSARPGHLARRQVVLYETDEITATVDNVVATAWTTKTRTANADATITGSVSQEQVIINEINVEYSYSSARTIFAVPTVVTLTTTQTAIATPYLENGSTLFPAETTTITNTIDAQATPKEESIDFPFTATLPLVSVLIDGATVTVSAQVFTYYVPNTGSPAIATASASATVSASAGAALTSSPVFADTEITTSAQIVASTNAGAPPRPRSTSSVEAESMTTIDSATTSPHVTASSRVSLPSSTPSSTSISTSTGMVETTTSSELSSTTQSEAASTTSAAISDSTQASFADLVLYTMNTYRSLHSAPFLTWDDDLASGALAYAETCDFVHSQDPSFGETLAAGTSANPTFYIDLWYDEGSSYNYNAPGFSDATGHFTQLVWASTTAVGCGFTSGCGQYPNYMVCRYTEAGNVVGGTNNDQYFIANVLPS